MVSVGFGCTQVICCQGKEAKFFNSGSFQGSFPGGAVVCLSHPQKQLWEWGMGREGLALPCVLRAGTGTSSPPCMNRKKPLVPVQLLAKSICACFFMTDRSSSIIRMATLKSTKSQSRGGSYLKPWQEQFLRQKHKNNQAYHKHTITHHDF